MRCRDKRDADVFWTVKYSSQWLFIVGASRSERRERLKEKVPGHTMNAEAWEVQEVYTEMKFEVMDEEQKALQTF